MAVEQDRRKARRTLPSLTDKQAETLAYMYTYRDADPLNRLPPRRRISSKFGISRTAVVFREEKLLEAGCLSGSLSGYVMSDLGMDAAEAWIQGTGKC